MPGETWVFQLEKSVLCDSEGVYVDELVVDIRPTAAPAVPLPGPPTVTVLVRRGSAASDCLSLLCVDKFLAFAPIAADRILFRSPAVTLFATDEDGGAIYANGLRVRTSANVTFGYILENVPLSAISTDRTSFVDEHALLRDALRAVAEAPGGTDFLYVFMNDHGARVRWADIGCNHELPAAVFRGYWAARGRPNAAGMLAAPTADELLLLALCKLEPVIVKHRSFVSRELQFEHLCETLRALPSRPALAVLKGADQRRCREAAAFIAAQLAPLPGGDVFYAPDDHVMCYTLPAGILHDKDNAVSFVDTERRIWTRDTAVSYDSYLLLLIQRLPAVISECFAASSARDRVCAHILRQLMRLSVDKAHVLEPLPRAHDGSEHKGSAAASRRRPAPVAVAANARPAEKEPQQKEKKEQKKRDSSPSPGPAKRRCKGPSVSASPSSSPRPLRTDDVTDADLCNLARAKTAPYADSERHDCHDQAATAYVRTRLRGFPEPVLVAKADKSTFRPVEAFSSIEQLASRMVRTVFAPLGLERVFYTYNTATDGLAFTHDGRIFVNLAQAEHFLVAEQMYSTLCHELGHAQGDMRHSSRWGNACIDVALRTKAAFDAEFA